MMFELADPPNYEPPESENIDARATRAGVDPNELMYDLLLQDDGKAMVYVPFANYVNGSLDAVGEMLAHPYTVPGLSDGGARVGPICARPFTTLLLPICGG